jgi:hypothetical protein
METPTTPPPYEPGEERPFEPLSPGFPSDNGPHPVGEGVVEEGIETRPPSPVTWDDAIYNFAKEAKRRIDATTSLAQLFGEIGAAVVVGIARVVGAVDEILVSSPRTTLVLVVVGGATIVATYRACSALELSTPVVWRHVAGNDLDLGSIPDGAVPQAGRAFDPPLAAIDAALHNQYRNAFCWRHNLAVLFDQIGLVGQAELLRGASATRRARMDAGRRMLHVRDVVFSIRARVFNNLARETVREDNRMNRAIVNREVLNVMRADNSLNTDPHFCSIISEAAVAACFIDTVYDEIGQEIAFGPPGRPL